MIFTQFVCENFKFRLHFTPDCSAFVETISKRLTEHKRCMKNLVVLETQIMVEKAMKKTKMQKDLNPDNRQASLTEMRC